MHSLLLNIIKIKRKPMNQKKENLLNIEYHLQRGLTLSWNLRGLITKDIYFRHLFIFLSDRQSFLENALALICLKIKIGDFIAFLFKKRSRIMDNLSWSEKTSYNFDKISLRGISKMSVDQLLEILPVIGQETVSYSNPVMVNIFAEEADGICKIKQAIHRLRVEGCFPYHVNFFGDYSYHDISTATGFNRIHTCEDSLPEVVRIYRSLAFESAVLRMKVQLDCENIQLTTRKDGVWEGVDFGRIKRFYYGPSIYYEHDSFVFLDETMHKEGGAIPMVVSLEITLFSGKVLRAEKSFILTTENLRLYGMTRCDNNEPRSTYEFAKMVRSKTQPFCSTTCLVIAKFLSAM